MMGGTKGGHWYRDGLRFECTGCGNCCAGAPGYVWVTAAEIESLARHLRLSRDSFARRYLRRVGARYSLLERRTGECIFFREGGGCAVYPVRPTQCRTFPFWPEHLKSPGLWEDLKRSCPGAGQGRFFPAEEIGLIRRGKGNAAGV